MSHRRGGHERYVLTTRVVFALLTPGPSLANHRGVAAFRQGSVFSDHRRRREFMFWALWPLRFETPKQWLKLRRRVMNTAKLRNSLLIAIGTLGLVSSMYGQDPTANMIAPAQMHLMPVPASVQIQTGRLPITGSFNVAV